MTPQQESVPCDECKASINEDDISYSYGCNEEGEDYTQINVTCPNCREETDFSEWGHVDSGQERLQCFANYIGYDPNRHPQQCRGLNL